MSYEKQNFTNNQVLTHNHLNHIEDGIETVENTISNIWQTIYPVGAIYISMSETSPASLFGGTWERIVDRFLLAGSSVSYPIGDMGGEATHILTEEELPVISGRLQFRGSTNIVATYPDLSTDGCFTYTEDSGATWSNKISTSSASHQTDIVTLNIGGGATHNNMPPYLSVYMWKRTA